MKQELLQFTDKLIKKFHVHALKEGIKLYFRNQVSSLSIHYDELEAEAFVGKYFVEVDLFPMLDNGTPFQECSCPKSHNCQHVAALLYAVQGKCGTKSSTPSSKVIPIAQNTTTKPSTALSNWLMQIENEQHAENNKGNKENDPAMKRRLLYLFNFQDSSPTVTPVLKNIKKNGEFSAAAPATVHLGRMIEGSTPDYKKHLENGDWDIFISLYSHNIARLKSGYNSTPQCSLTMPNGDILIQKILTTGRAYSANGGAQLQWGAAQRGTLSWQMVNEGTAQQVVCEVEGNPLLLTALNPICYFDRANNTMGKVEFDENPALIRTMLQAPPIQQHELAHVQKALQTKAPALAKYAPVEIKTTRIQCEPKGVIRAFTQNVFIRTQEHQGAQVAREELLLNLSFDYDGHRAVAHTIAEEAFPEEISVKGRQEIFVIERQEAKEKELYQRLIQAVSESKIILLSPKGPATKNTPHFAMPRHEAPLAIEGQTIFFLTHIKPILDSLQITLEIDNALPFHEVHDPDDWSIGAKATTASQFDWFDISLDTLIDGQRVNMLPALLRFAQQVSRDGDIERYLATISDEQKIPIPTTRNEVVLIAGMRLKNLLRSFAAEFAATPLKDGFLQLSKWQAALLMEMEKGEAATKTRLVGPDQLRRLAESLRGLDALPETVVPASLKCSLRPYQQDGLNWLQFLRSCDLNGILADDMGLGKTIQTLAHIVLEKESGRMTLPTLIIAPTSLMPNWKMETQRFAPHLKTITLQGPQRYQHFEAIDSSDMVFTTYPLLMRDKDNLLKHRYHLLILDEAQQIKNARTQAYQVVQQLEANHRLCLTGTPMENHLGEIWSLFNFLVPGLLGDNKRFHTAFRHPIEKLGNQQRKALLVQRIKPFLLRRTKQEVASDLPEKTEIIQRVEMDKAQRDLYETIRLKAQQKVMQQVAEKGLERSQIIILDALLKLRQVCCDPRLVKMEGPQSAAESAKLNLLMDMLPEMLQEKRQVLLFSQFTSMLALIVQELEKLKIPYVILTGDTTDRETPIREFQAGNVPLMLLSLKAGGVGLNLTAADTVILYDPWWNPAVESQAMDRAHRIGQKKKVFVYKLVTTGSVEEKILELQELKKELTAAILDGKENSALRITMEDIENIFQPLPPPVN